MVIKCYSCEIEKDISEFHKNKNKKYGVNTCCKTCSSLNNKNYRLSNIEKLLTKNKEYKIINKEKLKEQGIEYVKNNKEKIKKYQQEYKKTHKSTKKIYLRKDRGKKKEEK